MSRQFTIGRQSEQFYNEELYRLHELLKNIDAGEEGPDSDFDGALWLNKHENTLYSFDHMINDWRPLFDEKFRLIDQMTETEPSSAVKGQLWINPHGVLHYHDGTDFKPVRAMAGEPTDYSVTSFLDYLLMSPLVPAGNKILLEEGVRPIMQFLVPYADTTRVFMGGDLDKSSTKINQLTMQYAIQDTFEVYEIENPEEVKEAHGDPNSGDYYESYDLSSERWVPTDIYQEGDVVAIEGIRYKCTKEHEATEENNPQGFFEDEKFVEYWAEGWTYKEGDIVDIRGEFFRSKQFHTADRNNEPPEGEDWEDYWELLPEDECPWKKDGKDISGFVALNINGVTYAHSHYVKFDEETQELKFYFMELRDSDLVQVIYTADEPQENYLPHVAYVNPSRLIDMQKRLFLIDKVNGRVEVSPQNTEFYLFKAAQYNAPSEVGGIFLEKRYYKEYMDRIELKLDDIERDLGEFRYVLAVTYSFGSHHGEGLIRKTDTVASEYFYVPSGDYPFSLFADGEKIGPEEYSYDQESEILDLDIDAEEIGVLDAEKRQRGHIVRSAENGEGKLSGVIRLTYNYAEPLVFIDGILISSDKIEREEDTIKVEGIEPPARYAVIEATGQDKLEGIVGEEESIDISGTPFEGLFVEQMILFLNGRVVGKTDIWTDGSHLYNGMQEGQHYLLLKDTEQRLSFEPEKVNAFFLDDYFHDSLVYVEGRLLCNQEAVETADLNFFTVANNEIKKPVVDFEYAGVEFSSDNYYIYETYEGMVTGGFRPLDETLQQEVDNITNSYRNGPSSVVFLFDSRWFDPENYEIDTYLFRYAEGGHKTVRVDSQNVFGKSAFEENGSAEKIIPVFNKADFPDPGEGEEGALLLDTEEKKVFAISEGQFEPVEELEDEVNFLPLSLDENHVGRLYSPQRDSVKALEDLSRETIYVFEEEYNDYVIPGIEDITEAMWRYENQAYIYKKDGQMRIKLPAQHFYLRDKNSVSLYIDGVKQYKNAETRNGKEVLVPDDLDCVATYVVEQPTEGRGMFCERITADDLERVEGANNLFRITSHKDLYPGHLKVYLGGLRQSWDSYTIKDKKHIQLHIPTVEDIENLLIEVRPDYSIQEKTVRASHRGQENFSIGKNNELPDDVSRSINEKLIYVGGLLYNTGLDDYEVQRGYRNFYLLNRPFAQNIGINEKITFEWRS